MSQCIFCEPRRKTTFKEFILENEHAYVVEDAYPVSPGHCLVIPKQHFENWFVTPLDVQNSIQQLLRHAHDWLVKKHKPDGFNIGANCGEAAGQTIFHLHYHIIPRFNGDHPNPAGGVRFCVNQKDYRI